MTKDERIAELEREVEELKQRWQKQKEEAYYEYIKLRNNFEEKDRQCFEEELYIKHIKPYQNQKAIECLKEVIEELNYGDYAFGTIAKAEVEDIINNKIKELEGKNESI